MVGIYKIKEYDKDKINAVLDKIWDDIKVDEKIKEGMHVVIKPDLTIGNVEKDYTATNYMLVKLVAQKIKKLGAYVTICDRTDGVFTTENIEEEYEKLHLSELEDIGIKLNRSVEIINADLNFEGSTEVLELIKTISEADYIINMPKLKTNLNFGISAACTNMFGSITPDSIKYLYGKYPNNETLSKIALMVASTFKKQIVILDGIVASDTEGMANGKKVNFHHILASDNMYEIDYILSTKITKNIEDIPLIKAMLEIKGKDSLKIVELTGDDTKFTYSLRLPISLNKQTFLDKITNKKVWPVINENKCIKCKICVIRCPMEVIHETDHLVKMDARQRCTRCMYCVDQCPCGAINIRKMKVKLKKSLVSQLQEADENKKKE